ncbi:hypothetical protein IFR04_012785 [Cadophora malorum]|uniref:Uncharacterized protein n=1 Tax=Cadophora malorum TaxID=108018 RepID=A0A8H7T617_9HELO|nr:hypothetical protein IFR04_012785 [Cadophora malorum]
MQFSFNAVVGLLVATAVVAIPTPDTNVVSSIEARDNNVVNLFFDQSFKGQAFPITVKDGACTGVPMAIGRNTESATMPDNAVKCTFYRLSKCGGASDSKGSGDIANFRALLFKHVGSIRCDLE